MTTDRWRERARGGAGLACLALLASTAPVRGQADPAKPGRDGGEAADPAVEGHPVLRDPGGFPFRTPVHSPLEPTIRLGLAHVSRDGGVLVGLPDLGDRLSFWIRRAPGSAWELAGAVAGGVFSRFDLERPDTELVEVHYRAGLQLRARYRSIAARLELGHASSHLGDEHLLRTGREPTSTSREGIELLLQTSPAVGLLVYGGPGLMLRSSAGFDRPFARAGGSWEGGGPRRRGSAPVLAVETFLWSELDWRAAVSLEAGFRFGSRARLAATLGAGPSRAEQFFREDELLVGISFSFLR